MQRLYLRRVWRHQRVKQNRKLDNTIAKGQKEKHWSTKHTHTTKDRVTRTPVRTKGELRCFVRVMFRNYKSNCQSTPTPRSVVYKKEIDLTQQVNIVHSSWLSYFILLESTIKRIVKGVRIIHLCELYTESYGIYICCILLGSSPSGN